MFNCVGNFAHTAGREFIPDKAIEDHWLNCKDDYEVWIRDYYRMVLKLVEEVLQISVMLEVIDQDTPDILDPIYNRDKIYDRAIVNAEVAARENDDIMHKARYVISLTWEWIK